MWGCWSLGSLGSWVLDAGELLPRMTPGTSYSVGDAGGCVGAREQTERVGVCRVHSKRKVCPWESSCGRGSAWKLAFMDVMTRTRWLVVISPQLLWNRGEHMDSWQGCKFPLCPIYVTLGLGRVSQTKMGEFPGRAVIQIIFLKKRQKHGFMQLYPRHLEGCSKDFRHI